MHMCHMTFALQIDLFWDHKKNELQNKTSSPILSPWKFFLRATKGKVTPDHKNNESK